MSRTAVTHWSSIGATRPARARTGRAGSHVSSTRSRRRFHAADAGDWLDGAQRRIQVLRGMACQHRLGPAFSRKGAVLSATHRASRHAACRTAAVALCGASRFHDAHRLERRSGLLAGSAAMSSRIIAPIHASCSCRARGRNRPFACPQADRTPALCTRRVGADAGGTPTRTLRSMKTTRLHQPPAEPAAADAPSAGISRVMG